MGYISHLHTAHDIWRRHLRPGDYVIDATCGQGHDALTALQLILPAGHIWCIDIQKTAIEKTRACIESSCSTTLAKHVTFLQQCHSKLPKLDKPPKLIIYNLGYLPGSDKKIRTQKSSTMESLNDALMLIQEDGLISIMLYPGHKEGREEEEMILPFVRALDSKLFRVFTFTNLHRLSAPHLLLIQKIPR